MVTRDEELLDELLRLADAGGVEVTVAVDALAAEDAWARAPLVVVGADRVDELARRSLPPRLAVVLVAGPDQARDAALWAEAGALHAEHVVVLPDAAPWLVARFAQHGAGGTGPGAATVAVAGGSAAAGASEVAGALALTAHDRGLATMLVAAAGSAPDAAGAGGGAPGGLAVVSIDRAVEHGVAPRALAATLRAGQPGRDLIVVDLPGMIDDALLLAFTSADRGLLVVSAEVRDCAAANRLAAVARRHCPTLSLIVRSRGPRGLRPVEVAEALDLPLLGVLPPSPSPAQLPPRSVERDPLDRLCRRVVSEVRRRRVARVAAGLAGRVTP